MASSLRQVFLVVPLRVGKHFINCRTEYMVYVLRAPKVERRRPEEILVPPKVEYYAKYGDLEGFLKAFPLEWDSFSSDKVKEDFYSRQHLYRTMFAVGSFYNGGETLRERTQKVTFRVLEDLRGLYL